MKSINKFLTMLAALLLTASSLFSAATVFAADNVSTAPDAVTKTLTIHKLLLSEDDLKTWDTNGPKGYDGTQSSLKDLTGVVAEEIPNVYFELQKYNLTDGKEKENLKDDSKWTTVHGGLTTKDGLKIETSTLKGVYRIREDRTKTTYVGPNGQVLTGSKAVPALVTLPLVNNNGTVIDAHVFPKNSYNKPVVDKRIADTLNYNDQNGLSIGTKIPYVVNTTIPSNATFATSFWSDEMTEGLTYNEDVTITLNSVAMDQADYEVTKGNNGFNLKLTEAGLAKINGKDADQKIQITYSATLNSLAVADIPESNDITYHYGNHQDHGNTPKPTKPNNGQITVTKTWDSQPAPEGVKATVQLVNAKTGEKVGAPVELSENNWTYTWSGLDNSIEYKVEEEYNGYSAEYTVESKGKLGVKNWKDNNPAPINPEEPRVKTYGKKFVKVDQKDTRLENAQFVVKKADSNKYIAFKSTAQQAADEKAAATAKQKLDAAVAAYTNAADKQAAQALVDQAQQEYNVAYKEAKFGYVEVAGKDEAMVLTSNTDGQFQISGLAAGTYKLEEIKAPEGFAKIDDVEFVVGAGSWNQGEFNYLKDVQKNDATKVVNKKITIPQTGGIGTIIFAVAGAAIMGIAVYAYVKNNKDEDQLA
ncbi:TPA: isopeptide-forming domain-containing fimbrial protein [Streptococcus pneumoniae]|nr:isopeptide-forming domain-containing fimbrial protein [Streptococcus pneumoniae]